MLGINLRYEDAVLAKQNVLHITKVFDNTPANTAGLLENEYIIGCQESKIKSSEDILKILENNGEISLIVYNKTDKSVRKTLVESIDGTLGLELGTGFLHRISE